ncbi:hypothetical protein SAMD00019534_080260 [Acytostelium subglobosum LB1]|uniref:hypothetical protein n=1 Tax=Acytostelium subglobosum LB1 TaxID=1410327 RepID=UPI000645065E|nr:hypothetical protein SAMD00019534_080260 [Acytostelium subglobosum LB1]GAM24851.1 hypothetical protein SAMD00019534_080260 [Acytostelium subglobosum LB1]|eukprot:XP_012751940.1 hypothetical protein SAMD00019534_080260 [Acytostelium subglobosum LB1]
MIHEEDDEVVSFKPPDRSTSAPPILSLNSNQLFAFRPSELFNDIRCDENYFEFYHSHQNKDTLPPPLESAPSFYNFPANDDDQLWNNGFNEVFFRQNVMGNIQQQQQQQRQQQQQQQYFHQQQPHVPHQQYQQQHHHLQQQQHHQQQHLHQQQHHQQHHPQQRQHQQHHQQQHHQQHHPQQQHHQQQQQPMHPKFMNQKQNSMGSFNNALGGQAPIGTVNYAAFGGGVGAGSANNKFFELSPPGMPPRPAAGGPPPGLQLKMGQMTLNDQSVGKQQQQQDEITPVSFDVAYSTINQLYNDTGSSQHTNGNVGMTKSTSNSALNKAWKDKAFEPQPMRGGPGVVGSNLNKAVAPQQGSHIHAPTPVSSGNKLIGSDIESSFDRFYADPSSADTASGKKMNTVVPSRTPTPPNSSTSGDSSSPSQVCRYYTQGYCSRGFKCNFVHDSAEKSEYQRQQQMSEKSPGSSAPMSNHQSPTPAAPVQTSKQSNNGSGNGNVANNNGNASANNNAGGGNTRNKNQRKSLPNADTGAQTEKKQPQQQQQQQQQPQQQQSSNAKQANMGMNKQQQSIVNNQASNTGAQASVDINAKIEFIASKQYNSVEQLAGLIYPLCRDQNGCRFLQKKLEEGDEQMTEMIFKEVCEYMLELMTDPFGNYLCQKLLEHCNNRQSLSIIEKVGPDIVRISMNMHGTRAVQKMIEFLTYPEQIALIKKALANHVVQLIQDLNGNHVIQKCLNKLPPEDNQFIYDSVSTTPNCISVATHRHGCCVLQRCIDNASPSQKKQLINEIISNALVLVQDPFGNYVVQYVLDLQIPGLATEMSKRFLGHVPILATQKFSSNVVEKCLNVADPSTRGHLIQELIDCDILANLLQDPFANYVIQTSLSIAEPHQHTKLVEAIRPHLAMLKNTPYGKRIQNKIMKEGREYF